MIGVRVNGLGGQRKCLRALLLSATMDAPAKCLFQNVVQFNGFYGCPYCESPGATVQTSEKGHTHAYPFDRVNVENGHGPRKAHETVSEYAREAENLKSRGKQQTVKGVKGCSWFTFVPGFDIVQGVAIDYMHAVLIGVVKMLMTLWFDKAYIKEPWSINKQLPAVDERLVNIKPPNCISRVARKIGQYLCHWKASEFRSFLFYYGLPCLYGILEDEYFQHFLLLVESIWLMNRSSISIKDLKKSKALLLHFCMQVEGLYGNRYETFNVHCLLHLTRCVKCLGPLWSCSCFWYEDYNGDIRKLYHGTQKVDLQIALSVAFNKRYRILFLYSLLILYIKIYTTTCHEVDGYTDVSKSKLIHMCMHWALYKKHQSLIFIYQLSKEL